MPAAAVLDAPATASADTATTDPAESGIDPHRLQYAQNLASAEKRGLRVVKDLTAKVEAARARLAEATQSQQMATRDVIAAEASLSTARLLHDRQADNNRNLLRRSAPAAIGELREELKKQVARLRDQTPRQHEDYAAAQRKVKAITAALAELDKLELEALSAADLAHRLGVIRAGVDVAGQA